MRPNCVVKQIKTAKIKYKMHLFQNRALRKMRFKKLDDPTAQLYRGLKLLKFCYIVHLQNCLFMNQIEKAETLA